MACGITSEGVSIQTSTCGAAKTPSTMKNAPPTMLSATAVSYTHLDVYKRQDIDLAGLMEHIKGPDFPTGGIIMGRSGIRAAYALSLIHI